jgi:hypothetical protein
MVKSDGGIGTVLEAIHCAISKIMIEMHQDEMGKKIQKRELAHSTVPTRS